MNFDNFHTLLHHVVDYESTKEKKIKLLYYILILTVYISIQLALIIANFNSQEFIEEHYAPPFHLIAFWSVFFFSFIEAFILLSSKMINISLTIDIIKIIVLFVNVITTFIAALLISIHLEVFEHTSHLIEYTAQILITTVNINFVINNFNNKTNFRKIFECILSFIAFSLSILNILIYTEIIPNSQPEHTSHYIEFITETINALFTLFFAISLYKNIEYKIDHHFINKV